MPTLGRPHVPTSCRPHANLSADLMTAGDRQGAAGDHRGAVGGSRGQQGTAGGRRVAAGGCWVGVGGQGAWSVGGWPGRGEEAIWRGEM